MKITKLSIRNFAALESLDLEFPTQAMLVLGDNEAGKSSIRDAIEFALTGKARGLATKRECVALAHYGAKDCKATLESDCITVSRTPSSCSVTEQTIRRAAGPEERVRAVLNAFRFVEMSPAERRDLIAGISDGAAKAREVLADTLAKSGLVKSDTDAVLAELDRGIDKAEAYAVNERRAAKRARDTIAMPAEPPPASITVAGTEYDLDTKDTTSIGDRIAKLEAQLADATKRSGAGTATDRTAIEGRIKAADEILASLTGAATDTAAEDAELDRLAAAEAACRKPIAEADAKLAMLADRMRALDKIKGAACPTCGQAMSPETRAKLKAQLATEETHATGDMATAKANLATITKALDATRHKRHDVANAVQKRVLADADKKRAMQELAGADCAAAGADAAAKEVEVLKARIATGNAIRDAHAAIVAYRQGLEKQAIQDEAIARWDSVAQALGADGPVRKAAAGGFDASDAIAWASELLDERQVEVGSDWSIRVGGLPAQLLSRSARYRLGAAFAAAIARTAGLGLLVLDEADVLSVRHRAELLAWIEGLLPNLGTVLVLATSTERPAASPYPWLTIRSI